MVLNTVQIDNYASHYDFSKYCPRIVNMWKSLPDQVVDTDSLGKFWVHQEVFMIIKEKYPEPQIDLSVSYSDKGIELLLLGEMK